MTYVNGGGGGSMVYDLTIGVFRCFSSLKAKAKYQEVETVGPKESLVTFSFREESCFRM